MPVPEFNEIKAPALQFFTDGKQHKISEIYSVLAKHFNLTEEERLRVVAEIQRGLPPDAEVVPDLAEAFAERDRQDRERLERKRLLRPSAY